MPQNQQPQLLDHDTAYRVVHNEVYAPVFFTKLANDYGVRPANQQEAVQMLQMAQQLRDHHDLQEKQAAARGNPLLNSAQQYLNAQLSNAGYDVASMSDNEIEKAAAHVATNPEIAHATLSLMAAAAMAEQDQDGQ